MFKSGLRNIIKNYRDVSILPTLGKFMEYLVADRISILRCPFLSIHQHRFMAGHSTATILLIYSNVILDARERGVQVDMKHSLYTDYEKASLLENIFR